MVEMHKNLRKRQGMALLWRPRLRWEDIVKMDLGSCEVKWIKLTQYEVSGGPL